ncbi:GCG_CRPN prefix-to-repeats domain-containing protein [Methylobacterium sp. NFXW15]|uniref:GCG_CRPN prefix-to-repeats domain-containing protein n=1 Tax=Methylobacterium sp. NFXW15 TaxID=2819512 RepID=UPI003CEAF4CE
MAIVSAIRTKTLIKPTILAAALVGGVAFAGSAEAAGGCGPGFHPNPWGYCRPNYGPRPYWRRPVPVYGYGYARPRPVYRPYGYGYYGPRPFY